jgi:hypothetical protein
LIKKPFPRSHAAFFLKKNRYGERTQRFFDRKNVAKELNRAAWRPKRKISADIPKIIFSGSKPAG